MLQGRDHIGELDRRVLIQQESEGSINTANEAPISWANITNPNVWASVRESKGSEYTRSDQVDLVQQTIFKMRYRSDVTEKMRIVYNERPYYIESIVELGRKRFMDVYTMLDNEEQIT